ncbi:hypothetical protein CCHR01_05318 [Colletotrichum chrysophilum]|uniref:Uncharacterized protein n=1 Tax=Colletotrichum chrysophilum TaxID=1836956 RepID=A0AAD9EKV9_9PEZI|nr:hypothetical protein CCHR01_05318 [Colletotrichum chrysophilum]
MSPGGRVRPDYLFQATVAQLVDQSAIHSIGLEPACPVKDTQVDSGVYILTPSNTHVRLAHNMWRSVLKI